MYVGDLVLHKISSNIGLVIDLNFEYPDSEILWDDEMISIESVELMEVIHESR